MYWCCVWFDAVCFFQPSQMGGIPVMTQPTLIYSQPVMRPPNPFGPVPGAQVCIFKFWCWEWITQGSFFRSILNMLILCIDIINISYLCWVNYCTSSWKVHGRLASYLLVSMLTAASLCYWTKEDRSFSGIVFLGMWQWHRIAKADVCALCWRWAFSPKSYSMLLYSQSVFMWDWLLHLIPEYRCNCFFPCCIWKYLIIKYPRCKVCACITAFAGARHGVCSLLCPWLD